MQPPPQVEGVTRSVPSEVQVLWITAGLGCDGDTVSVTAATQPSIEDLLLGALPGLPRVTIHNPVIAYENGADFMRRFEQAADGVGPPFVLVIEGSIPNEKIKAEGYWAGFGTDPATGQPILTCDVDRPAGAQGVGRRRRRDVRDVRRHPRDGGQPDGCHGSAGLPRLGVALEGRDPDRLHPRLPRPARQLHRDLALPPVPGGRAGADDPARRGAAPEVAVLADTVHEGCDRGGYYEQGDFARRLRLAASASSSSGAGARSSTATSASAAG